MKRADRLLGAVAAVCLRILGATWRLEVRGENPLETSGRPAELGAIWHRDVLIAAYHFRGLGFSVPVSRSRDGDLIAALLHSLGYSDSPRGSSSRGGVAALRGIVRRLRAGVTTAVPTDGPRGPARVVKPGVLMAARLSGIPITPVAFGVRRAWRFASWDRTVLPMPFARVICHFGAPIDVPTEARGPALDAAQQRLEDALNGLADELDAELS